jgi:hypothetical protein
MRNESLMATASFGRIAFDLSEGVLAPSLLRGARRRSFGEPSLGREIGQTEKKKTESGLTVSARTSSFLVVGFDAARRLEMDDQSNIGEIDSHSEGIGRDENPSTTHLEGDLRARSSEFCSTRMIMTDSYT